jgi:hypothetical protein
LIEKYQLFYVRRMLAIDSNAFDLVGPGDGSARDLMGRDRQMLPEAEELQVT